MLPVDQDSCSVPASTSLHPTSSNTRRINLSIEDISARLLTWEKLKASLISNETPHDRSDTGDSGNSGVSRSSNESVELKMINEFAAERILLLDMKSNSRLPLMDRVKGRLKASDSVATTKQSLLDVACSFPLPDPRNTAGDTKADERTRQADFLTRTLLANPHFQGLLELESKARPVNRKTERTQWDHVRILLETADAYSTALLSTAQMHLKGIDRYGNWLDGNAGWLKEVNETADTVLRNTSLVADHLRFDMKENCWDYDVHFDTPKSAGERYWQALFGTNTAFFSSLLPLHPRRGSVGSFTQSTQPKDIYESFLVVHHTSLRVKALVRFWESKVLKASDFELLKERAESEIENYVD